MVAPAPLLLPTAQDTWLSQGSQGYPSQPPSIAHGEVQAARWHSAWLLGVYVHPARVCVCVYVHTLLSHPFLMMLSLF